MVQSLTKRRTYSAHHTLEDARTAANNLIFLLNGIPIGYSLVIGTRMGKYVLYSEPKEER